MPPAAGTSRDDLIRLLLSSVRRIANRHIRRVFTRRAIADDIYSAGLEGLVRGVDRYDPQHGEPRPYVERRIEGEIRDYLRSQDHLTRHFRDRAKATGVEPWAAPGSLDAPVRSGSIDDVTLCDVLSDPSADDPEERATRRHLLALLERAALALPPRTRDILRRHYSEDTDMAQIAAVYGVTESRVCQLVHEAHARIREALAAEGVDVAQVSSRPVQQRVRRRRDGALTDVTREILRRSAEARAARRGPRQCSACGETGHRRDSARHRR